MASSKERNLRIMDILVVLISTVALALSGWSLDSLVDLKVRQSGDETWKESHAEAKRLSALAETEKKSFSPSAADLLEIWKEIGEIRMMASISNGPPQWFIDRVDRIDARLGVMNGELVQIRTKINLAGDRGP